MDSLTVFGAASVSIMLLCSALEARSPWFVLAFAGACLASSAYGFLQGAWPFGVVEAIWSAVALRRWWLVSSGSCAGYPRSLDPDLRASRRAMRVPTDPCSSGGPPRVS